MDWKKAVRCIPLAIGVSFVVVAGVYLVSRLLVLP